MPEAGRQFTVDGLTELAVGTIATVRTALVPPTEYGSFVLVNHRPAEDSASEGLTIAAGEDSESFLLQIAESRPLSLTESGRTLVVKSFCSGKDGENREKCYPTLLTLAVDFTGIVEGVVNTLTADDVILAAGRTVTLDAATGYWGRGYAIPVEAGRVLSSVAYDAALLGYDADDNVILILESNPVLAEGLTVSLAAKGDCASDQSERCEGVSVTVVAAFRGVSAPLQAGASAVFGDDWTVSLALPAGYESGAKVGRVLEVVGGADLLTVSLRVNGDDLEHSPGGAAANALGAGEHTILVALGQTDSGSATGSLLGTVTLEVGATIARRDLDASDFGLSEPGGATITVAAGSGAVGAELGRVSLLESAGGARVVLPENLPAGLQENISVSLSGGGGVAVFYLTAAVAGGAEFGGTLDLTVTLDGNHNALGQPTGLTVSALAEPERANAQGEIPLGGAYEESDIHNFGSGAYAGATFVKTADEENSAGLTVSAEGVVGTEVGGIGAPGGLHTIVVEAVSDGYAGAARLELVLDLVEEGRLLPADTIERDLRARLRGAAPGYAGSVAFFAAGRDGVTLRTPVSAPAGFGFGTDGADRGYAAPDGFTLHIDAGVAVASGDTATASFAVIAQDAGGGFEDDHITVAVTVSVLSAPGQALLSTDTEENFEHGLVLSGVPGGLGGENGDLRIAGVVKDGASDLTNPFRIEGVNLRPASAGGVAYGDYEVSIGWTHPNFAGELTLLATAAVAEAIVADDVLPAAARDATLTVAAGYSGPGHAIPPSAGYEYLAVGYDETRAAYDAAAGHVIEVLQGSAVTLDLTLAVTVTAGCLASTGRRCSARGLTVSVTFIPVHPFAQERLEAADDEGFRHTIATGGYSPVGMRVKEAVGGRAYWFDLTMAADASWALIPNATTPPEAGRHTVLLGMTHVDFRGELELAVTTRIQETLEPADVVAALNPTVDAAPGYFGRGYAISVESGHVLSDESYNATLLGYDAESGVISILSGNPVPDSGELLLTLAGEGSCADRDCRAEAVTVISAFRALRPPAQDIASGAFGSGWTLSLNFPAGYENEREGGRPGRKSELLYPLALAADGESCAALGGTHTAVEDLCAGHAAELDVCTFSSAPAVAARYDSCAEAFARARECNLAGRALRTNDACAASDCGANTFALGGKCLALSLNGLGDLLAHTPQGADDALNAGTRPLAVGMTQRDAGSELNSLLGTIILEARAEIVHLPLDGRFLLSPPHPAATITIAAGTGAVGLELARVSLAASDAVIGVHTRGETDSAGFPENISLRYLPADGAQTVVFYLSSEPGGNGLRTERTAMLTVASRNLNYGFRAQDVTLEIKALRDPDLAEFGGTIGEGKAYNSSVFAGGVLHGFKRGDYETATNFARVAGSSEELLVDAATGEVKTDGDITLAGVYTLAVDAASPDFLGRARLELRLNIGFEGEFQPTDTIGSEDRIRDVAVVPGYAGSVAFFSAATMGVTLRTPTVAPVGFSFGGAEALDADFESPAGFTVFLEAGEAERGGETALGAFTVSALAAGFTPQGIELTVRVTALALPEQSTVVRGHLAGEYGSATLLADYSLEDNWVVAGASSLNAAGDAYVPVADWRARLAIAGAAFLRPVDGLEAGERLAAGKYRVTVETTHADFLGTLRLTVPLDIQETLEAAAVVSAAGRNATITVAAGHSGDGYAIPVGAGYEVRTVLYDADAVGYDRVRDVILIPAGSPIGADDLELAVTLTAGCADAGRNCAPLGLTVTALFIPLQAFAQSALRATSEEDFAAHTIAVGGYAGATLTIAGIAGGEISLFALDGSGGIVRNNDNPPGRGRYTITVGMTHAGFAGTLGLLVTAQIQEALALDDIVPRASRDVTVTVAAGYSGDGYQIPLKTGEHLFQTVLYDAARVGYDLDNHFIRIPAGAGVTDEVTLAVTATAGCVDASRDCAPRGLTVSATFVPLGAFAQEELTAFYDEDFAAHRVRVGGYAGDSGAELAIGGITGGDFFELDGTGRRIVRNDGNRPSAGRYIITVEMTHTGDGRTGGFLGRWNCR